MSDLDVWPADDPRRPEQSGDRPSEHDHNNRSTRCPPNAVRQRSSDAHVAVDADQQQVRNRRVADRVVQRQPRVAYDRT